MYISKIELKNIRGFKELSFDLERPDGTYAGWTVFTGGNGSGKSTLLKAIAVCLMGRDSAHSLEPRFDKWRRDGTDMDGSIVQLTIVPVEEIEVRDVGGHHKDINHVKVLAGPFASTRIAYNTLIVDRHNVQTRETMIPLWFSCGYGPYRRVFGASPDATRQMTSPVTEQYVTMFQEAASLFEVDRWLRLLNYRALEGKTEEREQLDLVLQILRDDLLPNEITIDRVNSDGLWLKDRNGVQLAWSDMSDGYRSALALLADILRHMIATYGVADLTERDIDGKLFVKRSGVVLIDEIDAHLHPEWQRVIGFWLKKHFPNIQFLVTSHSPIICQAADPNGLFVLPEPGSDELPRALTSDEYQEVIASRPDTILLSPAFHLQNTRSPIAVDARAAYAKLQAKRRAGAALTPDEIADEEKLRPLAVTDEEL